MQFTPELMKKWSTELAEAMNQSISKYMQNT